MSQTSEYVESLVKRAKAAQEIAEGFSQEFVDELVAAIAWVSVKEDNVEKIAKLAFEESRMGNYESKLGKMRKKPRGVLRELKAQKSVGIIEEDKEKGLIKIAKPVGVIGALVPCTNPEVTPVIKGMNAIKGRNAVIFSPHPRTQKTTYTMVEIMRDALDKLGAPKDLLICAENPTVEMSGEIMKQCDLVIATGGGAMVKAAYSSGTPAYGVGAGNAVVVIDETADIKDAAHKIVISKINDYASGCSSENSIIIKDTKYDEMMASLLNEGAYLCNADEKAKLQNALWVDGHLNKNIVAQSPKKIAEIAGIDIPEETKILMVEETGIGKEYPFCGEKLSVVLTVYKYSDFDEAIDKVNDIQSYSGAGHSCGIHSTNEDHIMKLSLGTKTSRVMVRQPQNYGNSGDWANGMPWTVTLGCGTWGGNIAAENVVFKHYINTTWVAYPIEPKIPTDEELFGDMMNKF